MIQVGEVNESRGIRFVLGGLLAISAAAASASSPGTNFGVRQVGYGPAVLTVETVRPLPLSSSGSAAGATPATLPIASSIGRSGAGRTSLAAAAALGRNWGTV